MKQQSKFAIQFFETEFMAKVSIHLNFPGTAEEAFIFYKSIFKTEWSAPFMRMGDMPAHEGMPAPSDEDKNKIMHVAIQSLLE